MSVDAASSWRPAVAWAALGASSVALVDAIRLVVGGRLGLGSMGVLGVLGLDVTTSLAVALPGLALAGVLRRRALVSTLVGAWLPAAGWLSSTLPGLDGIVASVAALALVAVAVGGLPRLSQRAPWGDRAAAAGLVMLALVLGLSTRVRGGGRGTGPNVLLVTVSSWRADRVGAHRTDTAAYDRLVLEGTRFDLAVAPHTNTRLAAELLLEHERLASTLRAQGYATGAFVGTAELGRGLGLDDGFDIYDDDHAWPKGRERLWASRWWRDNLGGVSTSERSAGAVVDRVERFVSAQGGAWFAWVHLDDPSAPYLPPTPWDERYYEGTDPRSPTNISMAGARLAEGHGAEVASVTDAAYLEARYDGEVGWADQQIAGLLAHLDDLHLASNTLVVVAGLHGERLREGRGWFGHEGPPHPAVADVPLVIRWPGHIQVGGSVSSPFSLVELGPTVLEFLGIEPHHPGSAAVIQGLQPGPEMAVTRGLQGAGVRAPGAMLSVDSKGAVRAWRRPDGRTLTWTPERIQEAVQVAVEALAPREITPKVDVAAIQQELHPAVPSAMEGGPAR